MFGNLFRNKDKFKLMINFGSGAEFDRTIEISNACTDDLKDRTPQDFYGMSKKIITNESKIDFIAEDLIFGAIVGPTFCELIISKPEIPFDSK